MKIKIDENLAQAHRRILEAAGHDVADVHDERLAGASDHVLWSHVCGEGRFLVTLDTDFSDIRQFLGSPQGFVGGSWPVMHGIKANACTAELAANCTVVDRVAIPLAA